MSAVIPESEPCKNCKGGTIEGDRYACPVCNDAGRVPISESRRLSMAIKRLGTAEAALSAASQRIAKLEAKINTPELVSFRDGVVLEAVHQRERWGSAHDDGKQPADWFWLVGYLAGKALAAHMHTIEIGNDPKKALHHIELQVVRLMRLLKNDYMPWGSAGGPNECKHGVAAGIACRQCDYDAVLADTPEPQKGEVNEQ